MLPFPFLESLPSEVPDITALGVAGLAIWGLYSVVKLTKEERDRDREERREDRSLRRAEASAQHGVAEAQREAIAALKDAIAIIQAHVRKETG